MQVGDLALWKPTHQDYDELVVIVKVIQELSGEHYYCRTIDDPCTYLVPRRHLEAVCSK